MTTIRIEVKKTNIREGIQDSWMHCPIALALGRYPGFRGLRGTRWKILVGAAQVHVLDWWTWDNKCDPMELPDEAVRFIKRFDANGRKFVEPFAFDLDVSPLLHGASR